MRYFIELLSAIMIVTLISCGGSGGGGGEKSSAEAQKPAEQQATQMSADMTAAITGTVHFQGEAPPRKPLDQDRECRALHDQQFLSQDVVVNDNGTLKWVFVYVKSGLGDRKFPTPSQPVEFDQHGCRYEPHVFGIQTGQTLKIVNSDPLLHNIHALPKKNRPFNFGMPNKGDVREQSFKVPEVMVRIKCDVHSWMSAYCGVLDNPYFSVTRDDGTFSIENLPPGQYVIEAWHETYGTQTQTVTVGDNETKVADFTFGKSAS
jgi:plastocyanin